MSSILIDAKKMVGGITEDYLHFDTDIIMYTNMALATATQLGVGPKSGFSISGSESVWTDFIPESALLQFVKPYICAKVKLSFDPPSNSAVLDALKNMIAESEWRILAEIEIQNSIVSEEV